KRYPRPELEEGPLWPPLPPVAPLLDLEFRRLVGGVAGVRPVFAGCAQPSPAGHSVPLSLRPAQNSCSRIPAVELFPDRRQVPEFGRFSSRVRFPACLVRQVGGRSVNLPLPAGPEPCR